MIYGKKEEDNQLSSMWRRNRLNSHSSPNDGEKPEKDFQEKSAQKEIFIKLTPC
jgi:hypothetical protein